MRIISKIARLFKDKCVFCGLTEGESGACMHHVGYEDAYNDVWYYFHTGCYKQVLNNPEQHENKLDIALKINELLASEKRQADRKIEKVKAAQSRAKQSWLEKQLEEASTEFSSWSTSKQNAMRNAVKTKDNRTEEGK